ncbi:hypothetical protein [Candidatus Carsonella ruddii]|uniref:hypothetical protein n=1 Tax=Carsonella ruddii TaxID=114186 RepID=UPI00247844BE|nr:hypothetical protein [Candidatus Carsonella ruddii]WGS66579.1 hypothetical protein MEJ66_00615 [Candidatus Carsonella ruddii]
MCFFKIKLNNFKNYSQKKIFFKKKKKINIKKNFYSKKKLNLIGFVFVKKKYFFLYKTPYWFSFNIKKIKKFINFYFLKKKKYLLKRYLKLNFFFKNYNKKFFLNFIYLKNKTKIINKNKNIFLKKKITNYFNFNKDYFEINFTNETKICLTSFNYKKIKKNFYFFFNKINIIYEYIYFYNKKKIFFLNKSKILYIGFFEINKFKNNNLEISIKKINRNFYYKKKISLKIKKNLKKYINFLFNNNKFFFLKINKFNKFLKNGYFNILIKINKFNIFFLKEKFFIFNIKLNI